MAEKYCRYCGRTRGDFLKVPRMGWACRGGCHQKMMKASQRLGRQATFAFSTIRPSLHYYFSVPASAVRRYFGDE